MSAPAFDLEAHRSERTRRLKRENELLRAERTRLECLLADALLIACCGTNVEPGALLEALAELSGTNLARPAYVEHRERVEAEAALQRVVRVLQETA